MKPIPSQHFEIIKELHSMSAVTAGKKEAFFFSSVSHNSNIVTSVTEQLRSIDKACDLDFRGLTFRMSPEIPTVLTKAFRGFSHSLQKKIRQITLSQGSTDSFHILSSTL
jgi:hypothetical protein